MYVGGLFFNLSITAEEAWAAVSFQRDIPLNKKSRGGAKRL